MSESTALPGTGLPGKGSQEAAGAVGGTSRSLPDPAVEPTIRVERARRIVDVGRSTFYSAVNRGDIPTVRVGTRIVIPTAKFLEKFGLTASAAPQPPEATGG